MSFFRSFLKCVEELRILPMDSMIPWVDFSAGKFATALKKFLVLQTQMIMTQTTKNDIFVLEIGFENYFWWVLGDVWTRIVMPINVLRRACIHFLGQKKSIDFSPHFIPILLKSQLPKAMTTPESDSWGFYGGIPCSWVQGSPPTTFGRKKLWPEIPNPHSSPLCSGYLRKILLDLW